MLGQKWISTCTCWSRVLVATVACVGLSESANRVLDIVDDSFKEKLVGIGVSEARFMSSCAAAGVDFSNALVVARQQLHLDAAELREVLGPLGKTAIARRGDYADALFKALGASSLSYLDASTYEGADVIVDLNEAAPNDVKGRFSAVVESGTIEHVFRAATAIETIGDLVAPGGHLLVVSPTDGWAGHGFYQLSPEFFFRALAPSRGFDSVQAWLCVHRGERWYRLVDPLQAGRRIEFHTPTQSSIFLLARRSSAPGIERDNPVQSDYAAAWTGGTQPAGSIGALSHISLGRLRAPALRLRRRLLNAGNGGLDPRYFQRVDKATVRSGTLVPR